MANTPEKLLSMYERGVLTFGELVGNIIPVTTDPPTAEFIARLPDGAEEGLRELASYPADTEWLGRRPDIWRRGLTLWREYFGIAD
jgi:hypothetical protein